VSDDITDALQKLAAHGTSCWDCWWFKSMGLCCPTHGTPEEKKAADREVTRHIYAADEWWQKTRKS
jgi:hypothetical protein